MLLFRESRLAPGFVVPAILVYVPSLAFSNLPLFYSPDQSNPNYLPSVLAPRSGRAPPPHPLPGHSCPSQMHSADSDVCNAAWDCVAAMLASISISIGSEHQTPGTISCSQLGSSIFRLGSVACVFHGYGRVDGFAAVRGHAAVYARAA